MLRVKLDKQTSSAAMKRPMTVVPLCTWESGESFFISRSTAPTKYDNGKSVLRFGQSTYEVVPENNSRQERKTNWVEQNMHIGTVVKLLVSRNKKAT